MMCSNKWAKPVLPFGSSLEPTLYQVLIATTGALRSSWTMTVRPLSSTNLLVRDGDLFDQRGDRCWFGRGRRGRRNRGDKLAAGSGFDSSARRAGGQQGRAGKQDGQAAIG